MVTLAVVVLTISVIILYAFLYEAMKFQKHIFSRNTDCLKVLIYSFCGLLGGLLFSVELIKSILFDIYGLETTNVLWNQWWEIQAIPEAKLIGAFVFLGVASLYAILGKYLMSRLNGVYFSNENYETKELHHNSDSGFGKLAFSIVTLFSSILGILAFYLQFLN